MPKNAASARHLVRSALDGVAPDLAATPELLTGEPAGELPRAGRARRAGAATAQASLDVFCDELAIKFGADAADDIALPALRPRSGPHP
ncbi:hypothetical protein PV343_34970 [Streptomyces sp. WI03-4A]|uniref:hypothetical protein n=1 Tax=Streptomyces sp. WI03-4A TaxID=3028706 RepID=UPI0029BB4F09|nr:hypothetical protein [Streptomyces sp. WI03-4A]MDX2597417.1 hypothetical protein [Streptomyces sp. WI03-4A]